jgi:hypothetical protein
VNAETIDYRECILSVAHYPPMWQVGIRPKSDVMPKPPNELCKSAGREAAINAAKAVVNSLLSP